MRIFKLAATGVAVMDCQPICEKSNIGVDTLIDRAVALSGVRTSDHIVITGHPWRADWALPPRLHAGRLPEGGGAVASADLHRLLWILDRDAGELRTLMAECAVDLRIAGILVAQSRAAKPKPIRRC